MCENDFLQTLVDYSMKSLQVRTEGAVGTLIDPFGCFIKFCGRFAAGKCRDELSVISLLLDTEIETNSERLLLLNSN